MDYPDDDEATQTVACPHCGQEVYEEAERCPDCGFYICDQDGDGKSQPTWVIVTACLLLALFIYFALAPFLAANT